MLFWQKFQCYSNFGNNLENEGKGLGRATVAPPMATGQHRTPAPRWTCWRPACPPRSCAPVCPCLFHAILIRSGRQGPPCFLFLPLLSCRRKSWSPYVTPPWPELSSAAPLYPFGVIAPPPFADTYEPLVSYNTG